MSLVMVNLPSDPNELRAFAQALQAQHAARLRGWPAPQPSCTPPK
jgi:hypothetical protein